MDGWNSEGTNEQMNGKSFSQLVCLSRICLCPGSVLAAFCDCSFCGGELVQKQEHSATVWHQCSYNVRDSVAGAAQP